MAEGKIIRIQDSDDEKKRGFTPEEIAEFRAAAARREAVSSNFLYNESLQKEPGFITLVSPIDGVVHKQQDKVNNCGQTCLRMVDVNEEAIQRIGEDNDRQLNTADMFALVDKGDFLFKESYEFTAVSSPQVVLCAYPGRQNHWVVQAGEFVLDPARGIMKQDLYQKRYQPQVLAAFERTTVIAQPQLQRAA